MGKTMHCAPIFRIFNSHLICLLKKQCAQQSISENKTIGET
jgi:hypothetical protein